jgi:ABC-type phosphate transport system ATPase subunit
MLVDRPTLLHLGELIDHSQTETTFTEPNDPRTKAYVETAFGWNVSRTY